MNRAHEPNSVVHNKFFFRKFLAPVCVPDNMNGASPSTYVCIDSTQLQTLLYYFFLFFVIRREDIHTYSNVECHVDIDYIFLCLTSQPSLLLFFDSSQSVSGSSASTQASQVATLISIAMINNAIH